jgi:hypothetical protein
MKECKLDVKIMGVKKRADLISDLLGRLGLDISYVVLDDRGFAGGGDAWYNAKRAWLSPVPEGVTHRLVLQDDVMVCDNFLKICNKIINVFPDVIFTLYGGTWIKPQYRKNDSPYVNVRGCGIGGVATIIPVEHISKMMVWSDKVLGEDYKHDDGRIGFYALCNGVKILGTIPDLTDHRPVDTCIRGHNRKDRVSKSWIGEDIGYQDWDNKDYNNAPFQTNDIWIFGDQERYDRINAVIQEGKRRFFDAETKERQ